LLTTGVGGVGGGANARVSGLQHQYNVRYNDAGILDMGSVSLGAGD
jgi:hypothetical protein